MTFKEHMRINFNYEVRTTFWDDLAIADRFGKKAIIDTFDRVCKAWLSNVEYFTEFTLILNHRCWAYHQKNDTLCKLYSDLYYKACDVFYKKYKDDSKAQSYFYRVLD